MPPSLQIGWCGPSHGLWGWIQSHFRNIDHLASSDVDDWCSQAKSTDEGNANKLLLVALENRVDSPAIESIIKRWEANPKPSMALLLGNDWHGHRRTYPIPEGIPAFYWYQWYDQVIPWISEVCSGPNQSEASSGKSISKSRKTSKGAASQSDMNLAWRVRWGMERSTWLAGVMQPSRLDGSLAWVITDHSDQSSLWQDACTSVGLRVIASRWDRDPAWFDPQLIIVDSVSRSDNSTRLIEEMIHSVRRRHPQACLAVVTPFPTWEQWRDWQSIGVDAVLPRPAFLQGFLFYWLTWKNRTMATSA